MPELQVLSGSLQWKTIPIAGERFLIGRKDSCHLILKDGWVSREHTLIIEPKPGEFRVQDLDSENGTFLNGERIRDSAMRHGDVLRVGRTEMRFIQHAGTAAAARTPVVTIPVPRWEADAGLRTEALDRSSDPEDTAGQTLGSESMLQTTADGGPKSDRPRIDLRERVRRLEEMLLEGEQANAALAAENAVLKRALARLGLLDKKTGAVDPSKLTPPPARLVPESMLRFVMNPLARITFPGKGPEFVERPAREVGISSPGLFRLGFAGIDSLGIRFAEAISRLGYRSTVAVTAERDSMRGGAIDPSWRIYLDRPRGAARPATAENVFLPAMPRIEDVFHEAFAGCERVLLCAEASGPLCGDALTHLADVVRRTGAQPGAVVFFDPGEDHVDARARADAAFAAARALAESGRLAPFIVLDQSLAAAFAQGAESRDPAGPMLDSIAGALDALMRLPALPSIGARLDPAATSAQLFARGWGTLGLAAARGAGRADLSAAAAEALGAGLMTQAMPPSRARAAFVCTIIGDGIELEPHALEAVHTTVARMLPQAQRVEGAWQDSGGSVRIIAFMGGLPFPETFFTHGHP